MPCAHACTPRWVYKVGPPFIAFPRSVRTCPLPPHRDALIIIAQVYEANPSTVAISVEGGPVTKDPNA